MAYTRELDSGYIPITCSPPRDDEERAERKRQAERAPTRNWRRGEGLPYSFPEGIHGLSLRNQNQHPPVFDPQKGAMPPQVSRMHPSHMSNPFVHLNSQHSIPQSSYQRQSSHLPGGFASQPSFSGAGINGGISPFPSSSTYGASAFTPGAGSSVFNGGTIGAQGHGQGLASVAAQQGFARGAAMQEHTAHQLEAASLDSKSGANSRIRQVWRHNLEQEMAVLRQLIIKYPYVSMVCYHSGGYA